MASLFPGYKYDIFISYRQKRGKGRILPLSSKEENPHDNLNHKIYRDQLNKVANAQVKFIQHSNTPQQKKQNMKEVLLLM